MKKHLCFSPLQFARDVLRQRLYVVFIDSKFLVAICAGCAEAKQHRYMGIVSWILVAICAGCAEAKSMVNELSEVLPPLQFARDVLRQSCRSGKPGI